MPSLLPGYNYDIFISYLQKKEGAMERKSQGVEVCKRRSSAISEVTTQFRKAEDGAKGQVNISIKYMTARHHDCRTARLFQTGYL